MKAAAVVERELPGIPLVVNDISLPRAGRSRSTARIRAAATPTSCSTCSTQGRPAAAVGRRADRPDGKGLDFKDLSVPRTTSRCGSSAAHLALHAGAARSGRRQVQRIFIVEHVRAMLLAEAERARAPRATARALRRYHLPAEHAARRPHARALLSARPTTSRRAAYDTPPTYPWHKGALAALGLAPVPGAARRPQGARARSRERTTSVAEAKKRAGPMHAKVRALPRPPRGMGRRRRTPAAEYLVVDCRSGTALAHCGRRLSASRGVEAVGQAGRARLQDDRGVELVHPAVAHGGQLGKALARERGGAVERLAAPAREIHLGRALATSLALTKRSLGVLARPRGRGRCPARRRSRSAR